MRLGVEAPALQHQRTRTKTNRGWLQTQLVLLEIPLYLLVTQWHRADLVAAVPSADIPRNIFASFLEKRTLDEKQTRGRANANVFVSDFAASVQVTGCVCHIYLGVTDVAGALSNSSSSNRQQQPRHASQQGRRTRRDRSQKGPRGRIRADGRCRACQKSLRGRRVPGLR